MKISGSNVIRANGTTRVEAGVVWEDVDRPPFTLFIQTLDEFGEALSSDANTALIACVLSAWQAGERRVSIDGPLCPLLVRNLNGVFMMLNAWYPEALGEPPRIESVTRAELPKGRGAVALMSGGIDSLCLLRANHTAFPSGHPHRIEGVVSVGYFQDLAASEQELRERFENRMSAVLPVATEAGVEVIPALTNLWWLNPDGYFYGQKGYSSWLASIASAFSRRFAMGYIASSYDAAFSAKPWGSHPQLDAYYSSARFRMENSGTEMTRLDKVAMIADWPVAFRNMRVCQNDNSGGPNCGTCEKCIRTMLMLESLGRLRDCTAFKRNDLDVELLEYLETYDMLYSNDPLHNVEKVYQYGLVLPGLERVGRTDLAERLKQILGGLSIRAAA